MRRGSLEFILFMVGSIALSATPARGSPTTIEGTVVDERGVAVSGLEVRIRGSQIRSIDNNGCFNLPVDCTAPRWSWRDACRGVKPVSTKSDKLGWFRLELEEQFIHRLELEVPSEAHLLPRRRVEVTPKRDVITWVNIVVVPEQRISGTVVCSGATLRPQDLTLGRITTSASATVDWMVSDIQRDGSFRISGLRSGDVPVVVDMIGCPRANLTLKAPSEHAVIQMPPGAQVSGVVLDARGHPVANASVDLDPLELQGFRLMGATDGNGRFTFTAVADGKFFVSAYKEGASDARTVTWHGESPRELNFRITPPQRSARKTGAPPK